MNNKKIIGLRNLGNTCYLNSILQCLYYTEDFTSFITRPDLTLNSKTDNTIINSYLPIIRAMKESEKTIAPVSFVRKFISKFNYSYEQQDSNDALIALLDELHESLSRKVKMIHSTDNKKVLRSKIEWIEFFEKKYSEIIPLFYGQLNSKIICKCGHNTERYDPFNILQCEIPTTQNEISLDNCLDLFFNNEDISDYRCDSCSNKKSSNKKILIKRTPNHLIIQLKRFIFHNGKYVKYSNKINCPLNLDIDKYVNNDDEYKKTKYELYGIVNHIGSMSGGHYYAFCKTRSKKWVCLNDASVIPLRDESKIITQNAYLLFYKKV